MKKLMSVMLVMMEGRRVIRAGETINRLHKCSPKSSDS